MATGVFIWSHTASDNATIDSAINWREGQSPSSVNDSARVMMGKVADYRDDISGVLVTTGTATAFVLDTYQAFDSLANMDGKSIACRFHLANGAAATLNVEALGDKAIHAPLGTALPEGVILASSVHRLTYVNASNAWVLNSYLAPQITSLTAEATVVPADEFAFYDVSASAARKATLQNILKVLNALTEDTAPDISADFLLSYDVSASDVKKVLMQNLPVPFPRGYHWGAFLSNGTDTVNDINVSVGRWRDQTDTANLEIPALTGKQLDFNWAAGSGAGMRYSASAIANGTYHIYAGRTAASATADVYAYPGVAGTDPDSAAEIANVLAAWQAEVGGASYAYIRRIGSIIRLGATILQFVQYPDGHFRWLALTALDYDGANSATATLRALTVPLGIKVLAKANIYQVTASGGVSISAPDTTATNPSLTAPPLFTDYADVNVNCGSVVINNSGFSHEELTNRDAQWRFDSLSTGTLRVTTLGYKDFFGEGS